MPGLRRRRVLLAVLAPLLALLAGEGLLRAMGRTPVAAVGFRPGQPSMYEADAELGWRLRAGEHVHGARDRLAPSVRVTVGADNTRSTGAAPSDAEGTLLTVGCSFTEGVLLDDEDTWPAHLQRALPDLRVVNCGVAGHGTYQTLLRTRRELAARDDVRIVVYGFIQHHEQRNVATAGWLSRITLHYEMAPLPFVSLNADGSLARHPPDRWTTLPLRSRSALVAVVESLWMRITRAGRADDARPVTEALLLELDATCRARGATLLVAVLQADEEARAHYGAFLAEHGIATTDVVLPWREGHTGRDGIHPSALLCGEWVERLAPAVERLR